MMNSNIIIVMVFGVMLCLFSLLHPLGAIVPVVLLYGLLFFSLIIRKPLVAIVVIIVTIPLQNISYRTGFFSLSVTNLVIIISTVAVFSTAMFRATVTVLLRERSFKVVLLLLILVMLSDLSSSISSESMVSYRMVVNRTGEFLIFILTVVIVDSREKLKKVLLVLYVVLLLVMLSAYIGSFLPGRFSFLITNFEPRNFGGMSLPFNRSVGLASNWGIFGCYIIFLAAFTYASLTVSNVYDIPVSLLLVLMVVIGGSLFVSQTRSTFMSLSAVLMVLWYLRSSKGLKRTSIVIMAFGIFLFLYYHFSTLETITTQVGQLSIQKRSISYRYGIDTFFQHPVFGIGHYQIEKKLHNVYVKMGLASTKKDVLHSMYLNQLVAGGLVGFVPYAALLIMLVRKSYITFLKARAWDVQKGFFPLVLFSATVGTLAEVAFVPARGFKFGWLLLGLSFSVGKIFGTPKMGSPSKSRPPIHTPVITSQSG